MNPDNSLQASMWLLILIQTIGAIDLPTEANKGKKLRKLPAPRVYVAVVITWAVLRLIADAGQERAAAVMGWVMVVAAMVVGPAGTTLINFFNSIANNFGTSGTTTLTTTPTGVNA